MDALKFIVEFIQQLAGFVVMVIESLVTAITVLVSAVSLPVAFTGFLPEILLTCMVCLVALATVKFLVGR